MPFVRAVVDQHGIAVAAAYGVITDWNLQGSKQIAQVELSWYANSSAYTQGFDAFKVDHLTLSGAEQGSGIAQLIAVLYGIVAARPEYQSVQIV